MTSGIQSRRGRIVPLVFHREGQPVKSFRHSWDTACKAAGVPARIFHDFRRTAVRNLEAVYRGYAITNDADLQAAAVNLAALSEPRTSTISNTVARLAARSGVEALAESGRGGRIRTCTSFRTEDFKSSAAASYATPPR